jgi:transcriptional regulator with XRE-family HTH domain
MSKEIKAAEHKEKTGSGVKVLKKKLSSFQWGELLALLKTGGYTQSELAEIYGVSATSISRMKIKHGIEVKSSLISMEDVEKTRESFDKAMGFSIQETGEIINKARKESLKRVSMVGKVAESLFVKAVQETLKEGGMSRLPAIRDDIKVLHDLQALFSQEVKITAECLGVKDGDLDGERNIPVLTIRKMEQSEIIDEQIKLSDGVDDVEDLIELNEYEGDEFDDNEEESEEE